MCPMVRKDAVANFPCLRKKFQAKHYLSFLGHKSHKKCVLKYLKSENGRKSKYLCPFKCS